jgi:hypothetical protein
MQRESDTDVYEPRSSQDKTKASIHSVCLFSNHSERFYLDYMSNTYTDSYLHDVLHEFHSNPPLPSQRSALDCDLFS